MKITMLVKHSIVLAFCSLCCAVGLQGQEAKISSRDVPEAVRTAFAKAFPTAKVKNWDKEVKDGQIVYEAEGIADGKISRSIMYAADGTLVQSSETVAVTDLPAPITEAISKQYAKAVIQSADKTTHGDTVEYVLKLKRAPVRVAYLDPSGKIIRTK